MVLSVTREMEEQVRGMVLPSSGPHLGKGLGTRDG